MPSFKEPSSQEIIDLAARLLSEAKNQQTLKEEHYATKLARMINDRASKEFIIAFADQMLRSRQASRTVNQLSYLLHKYPIPRYFSMWERAALKLADWVGKYFPKLVVALINAKLRYETRRVITPAENDKFIPYLQERYSQNIRLNINHLGEAILGEEEARKRLNTYLCLLACSDIEYISIKISSILSQISVIAFNQTVEEIKSRLRKLYRQAMDYDYSCGNHYRAQKFVNLDMEEYRDLLLTVTAFIEILDEPEFLNYRAGIALQAYLPDSFKVQRGLTAWSQERLKRGGVPIKIRIVKGANLAMEQVDAAWHGWEQAPYQTKQEVDANYKRMVAYGMQPEHARAAHLGIASHNLFDIAYAILLRDHNHVADCVEFEMLEGMANHQARAVQQIAGNILLYAPIVETARFHSAISYFARRLDENTAPDNFLHDMFSLEVGSEKWNKQKTQFLQSLKIQDAISEEPRRTQNRQTEQRHFEPNKSFTNEPDTDWALPQNQAWIESVIYIWQQAPISPIPLQIAGNLIYPDLTSSCIGTGFDPSRPDRIAYRYCLATKEHIHHALNVAQQARQTWEKTTIEQRKSLLVSCAEHLAHHRSDLLGAIMRDGGKCAVEADSEISEAIDLANYYARSFDSLATELAKCEFKPFGVILVAPPWNFPLAIPCGGVLAALMAGNTVILKPAPEAILVSWHLCKLLWQAGIPKNVLQFLPTTDDEIGQSLVSDDQVNAVILTGSYATGQLFQSWKPARYLFAETSGKNSMIITALADRDQAIKDLVQSAFGHNGQKCSAASLAVLEAEVYDDSNFMRQLHDAVASLKIGSQWDLSSSITPLIRAPGKELMHALTGCDANESWLLQPRHMQGNLWSPGIKLGVKPNSWYHQTECFGPVLGLMRAENLMHAIEMVNSSQFGLTSGLHSLDEREITYWKERIEAGNLYINRATTGAIVQRQPFGGWKKSVFGYAKAGGPNYVLSLGVWQDRNHNVAIQTLTPAPLPEGEGAFRSFPLREKDKDEERCLKQAEQLQHDDGNWQKSYQQAWEMHFSAEHDPSHILGESNIFRYRPVNNMTLRVTAADEALQIEKIAYAAQLCGVPLTISFASKQQLAIPNSKKISLIIESEEELIKRMMQGQIERLRTLSPLSKTIYNAANLSHVLIITAAIVSEGRLELRHYFREQSISQTTHRYGNIARINFKQ